MNKTFHSMSYKTDVRYGIIVEDALQCMRLSLDCLSFHHCNTGSFKCGIRPEAELKKIKTFIVKVAYLGPYYQTFFGPPHPPSKVEPIEQGCLDSRRLCLSVSNTAIWINYTLTLSLGDPPNG